jgi:hypothetical protein
MNMSVKAGQAVGFTKGVKDLSEDKAANLPQEATTGGTRGLQNAQGAAGLSRQLQAQVDANKAKNQTEYSGDKSLNNEKDQTADAGQTTQSSSDLTKKTRAAALLTEAKEFAEAEMKRNDKSQGTMNSIGAQ